METVRDARRTTVITLVSEATGRVDKIRACEPECRNEILLDLGVPHGKGGGWLYRSRGASDVTVAWSGIGYHVTWQRRPPSAVLCDLCGEAWMTRVPELVALAAERSAAPQPPPTEAQLRSREAFAARVRAKAAESRLGAAVSPPEGNRVPLALSAAVMVTSARSDQSED